LAGVVVSIVAASLIADSSFVPAGHPSERSLTGVLTTVLRVSSAPVLRPLGVGEILDMALAVYRRHASSLGRVVAVVVALPAALNGALAVAEQQVRDSDGSSGSLAILQVLLLVVSLIASSLATAAAYRLVADAYLGRTVDPAASLRFGARRFLSVIWISLLVGVLVAIASLFLLIPGIYLFVAWSVAVPALLGENLGITAALGRSRALVRGRFWPCAGVLILAVLLALIVTLVILGVLSALLGSSGNDTVTFLEQGVASLIANTLVLPFQVAVTTVLYIDLRVRKEGFDVQLLTHSLEPGGVDTT
jgi:hypothetical protein